MNGKKSKALRRKTTGDPELKGRKFADIHNERTWMNHPNSERAQYQQAKKEGK